ncbi:hypothetical protein SAMN04489743_2844 [Pseudarthrobacter equi]|uniref:Uncharacterized protein n=1 Tax=Pseudarthrobacter equi TaxID=728066 RepID=A0A1H2A8B5_9MICC|nr:DUF5403 family protein [Pseudarthrobacter equi]SDT42220.1 hypothetical protein SAMN04489743_2844 [Pseudarthrobacter equi]
MLILDKRQFSRMLKEKAAKTAKVQRFAEKAADALRAEIEPHRRTGQLGRSVEIQQHTNSDGIKVPFVALTHPAAYWIENGHWAGDGPETVWVEGIHVVSNTAKKLRRS